MPIEGCGSFVITLVALLNTEDSGPCAVCTQLHGAGSDSLYLRHHSAISILRFCSLLGLYLGSHDTPSHAGFLHLPPFPLRSRAKASFSEGRGATSFWELSLLPSPLPPTLPSSSPPHQHTWKTACSLRGKKPWSNSSYNFYAKCL